MCVREYVLKSTRKKEKRECVSVFEREREREREKEGKSENVPPQKE